MNARTKPMLLSLVLTVATGIPRLAHAECKMILPGDPGGKPDTIILQGCNLEINNGTGKTDKVNGLGNLVIGYDKAPTTPEVPKKKTGSHNLVVGDEHAYSSYGGIVAGTQNQISAPGASVIGGRLNQATAPYASVTGGQYGVASGGASSVTGGWNNQARANFCTVAGGGNNVATEPGDDPDEADEVASFTAAYSSVAGGEGNFARGYYSVVSGGSGNETFGAFSSVSAGQGNRAGGDLSSVSGGSGNEAQNVHASVSGGRQNVASGSGAAVSGGKSNVASGQESVVSGGLEREAAGEVDWAAGSLLEDQ